MEQPHTVSSGTGTTREQLESYIAAAAARVRQPAEGIFGADSLTWRISRESAVFLGAARAALLQLAHPWVAAALDQHSAVMQKPIKRFHNTFRVVFTMIFGTSDQAFRSARTLYQLHTKITGNLPEGVAGYAKGSRYEALRVPALRWVYATLIESAVIAYDCVMPPLSSEERAAYYEESKVLAGLFGLPAEALPEDWSGFESYIAEMLASPALGVSDLARAMGRRILSGAGSWIYVPRWYQALTAEWMPARFREEFGMPFGAAEQESSQRIREWLPRIYPTLPEGVRFVGPYQEVQARLQGRAPNFLERRSNVFWIGQARMPFGD
ncbi:MAG TPA: oxygenase MpaB family protein [Terracidiphilus sp.]|jgi:uncharacterized protein (DUF2236 family)